MHSVTDGQADEKTTVYAANADHTAWLNVEYAASDERQREG